MCDVYMQVQMYTLYTHRYCVSIMYFVVTCKKPFGPSLTCIALAISRKAMCRGLTLTAFDTDTH